MNSLQKNQVDAMIINIKGKVNWGFSNLIHQQLNDWEHSQQRGSIKCSPICKANRWVKESQIANQPGDKALSDPPFAALKVAESPGIWKQKI